MPKRLAEFDFQTRDPGRFDKVLDGAIWRIEKGEFGFDNMESLRASLKYAGDKKKVKVRTKLIRADGLEGPPVALVVQAYNDAEVHNLRSVAE